MEQELRLSSSGPSDSKQCCADSRKEMLRLEHVYFKIEAFTDIAYMSLGGQRSEQNTNSETCHRTVFTAQSCYLLMKCESALITNSCCEQSVSNCSNLYELPATKLQITSYGNGTLTEKSFTFYYLLSLQVSNPHESTPPSAGNKCVNALSDKKNGMEITFFFFFKISLNQIWKRITETTSYIWGKIHSQQKWTWGFLKLSSFCLSKAQLEKSEGKNDKNSSTKKAEQIAAFFCSVVFVVERLSDTMPAGQGVSAGENWVMFAFPTVPPRLCLLLSAFHAILYLVKLDVGSRANYWVRGEWVSSLRKPQCMCYIFNIFAWEYIGNNKEMFHPQTTVNCVHSHKDMNLVSWCRHECSTKLN